MSEQEAAAILWGPAPVPVVTLKLPPIPSRSQVCGVRTSLQGLTYQTEKYGPIPGGFFWWLLADRKTSVYPVHRTGGDTHIPISISSAYREPGTLWPNALKEGQDFTRSLPAFKALLREIIAEGFFPDVPLAGDGESQADLTKYNDAVGSTYGYAWLMANLARVLKAMRGDADSECPDGVDLTRYTIFRPGWDAVFYGWEPSRKKLRAFGELFRSVLPDGYLAIEHNTGHLPAGEGDTDWVTGGCMQHYDTILTEFDAPLKHNDNIWQIAARCLGPAYKRPSDQPPGDDPGSPFSATAGTFYLRQGTPRGPYIAVAFEYDTYHWVRGRISREDVEKDRAYLRSVGYTYVC